VQCNNDAVQQMTQRSMIALGLGLGLALGLDTSEAGEPVEPASQWSPRAWGLGAVDPAGQKTS
jgi:hypothetical protein